MNKLHNIKNPLNDKQVTEVAQPVEELLEIGDDSLEKAAGAGDGTAMGVGKD